jgi:hypothetical protein
MNTDRWSELSAKHDFNYTGNRRSFVTAISKTTGVVKGFYVSVVGVYGPKIIQELSPA